MLKTNRIGPGRGNWDFESASLADLAREQAEEQAQRDFEAWSRVTYAARHTVKNREIIERTMQTAMESLYDVPALASQLHWLLYHLIGNPHDTGAANAVQALIEPFFREAARPLVDGERVAV